MNKHPAILAITNYTLAALLLMIFASCTIIHNRKNVLNSNEWGSKNQQMKIDGYYYSQSTTASFPYYKNKYGGYSQDSSRPYIQQLINPVIFYENGTAQTFGPRSGLQENAYFNYSDRCSLKDENTIARAKEFFECDIVHYKDRYRTWGKGVYKVLPGEITIQYYINWRGQYYLIEKKGEIINDSAFVLNQEYDHYLDEKKIINEIYIFQRFESKPASRSYLLKHRLRYKNKSSINNI
jgi:hypothetical protein